MKHYSIFLCVILTACGGGGGSSSPDPITPPPATPPTPPTYTPPEWSGEVYTESDAKNQYATIEYSRTTVEDYKLDFQGQYTDAIDGGLGYKRTNLGLAKMMNSGRVLANNQDGCYECSEENNTWAVESVPMPSVVDINGDGLDDVIYAHRLGPNAITEENYHWQPTVRTLALINQGNGRLEVDPSIFESASLPITHDTFISHIADFNGDGYDDWLNIGEGGGYIQGGSTIKDMWQHIDELLQTNLMGVNYSEYWGRVWTHTTAIGDLDNDGDIDVFVPSLFANNDAYCGGCKYFVLTNTGDGTFELGSTQFPNYNLITASAISDVDQDGYADIILGSDMTNNGDLDCDCSGVILYGNEYKDYTQRIGYLPQGTYAENNTMTQMIVYDIDQDGREDLIALSTNNGSYEDYYDGHSLQVFINNGTGYTDKTDEYVDISKINDWEQHPTHGRTGGYMNLIDLDRDSDLDIWLDGTAYTPYYIWKDGKFVMENIINNKIPYIEGCTDIPNDEGTTTNQCGTATYGIVPIHIDTDGKLDWLVTNQVGTSTEAGIVLSQLMAE